ncbi:MAG TPA: hypothetical protein VFX56_02150 [Nitrospira sp.]|nr:hypothetical protein [Nitrospira sp.]
MRKMHMISGFLSLSAMFVGVGVGTGFAQKQDPTPVDAELRVMEHQLNEDESGRVKTSRAEALAKQFQVEPQVIENLRVSKQGWGEITIRLGLAQELTRTDPESYPTMTDALQKVGDLRAQKMGWGSIAQSLGFKLGPIMKEVRHARNEMRAETKKAAEVESPKPMKGGERPVLERSDKGNRQDKADKIERAEKYERPERAERPERPDRPDRPEKPERPEKVDRPGRN